MATEQDPPNPYGAPTSAPGGPGDGVDANAEPASYLQRFGGAVLDMVIHVVFAWGVAFALASAGLDPFPRGAAAAFPIAIPSSMLVLLAGMAPSVVQWVLVTRRGQTLGKIVVGSRIVRMDGRPVDFWHGVVLRVFPFFGLTVLWVALTFVNEGLARLVSFVSVAVGFVDAAFIVMGDRRCLHDLIARTRVITT